MKLAEIEKVLLEQQDELRGFSDENFIHRQEENLINLNSNLAQVVIGVRRSGKSTLCINALERAKVRYAYVNFDDERLLDISVDDMDPILEVLYKIYGDFTHLLLDEVQNVN